MKIVVLGADGFIGSNVAQLLAEKHEVVRATRNNHDHNVDLTKPETILALLAKAKPQVIVNCAGVVGNDEKAALNVTFTTNLLEQAVASKLPFNKIIILGSAAEYGEVDEANIPVKEDAPLNATSDYALSKMRETATAISYRESHSLPVVAARIFNPIGVGMNPKFLVPQIIKQIMEIREGKRTLIEVNRLDSKRDYVNVKDIAQAIKVIIELDAKYPVYNVGSGKATSNGELIELILNNSKLSNRPEIIETSGQTEPLVAIQADISRLRKEFSWQPVFTLEETIKEITNDSIK